MATDTTTTTPSRRSTLRFLASAPLSAIPAAGLLAAADPVLAKIRAHEVALEIADSIEDDECHVRAREACLQELARMQPVTTAGAAAMLRHFVKCEEPFVEYNGSPMEFAILNVAAALERLA